MAQDVEKEWVVSCVFDDILSAQTLRDARSGLGSHTEILRAVHAASKKSMPAYDVPDGVVQADVVSLVALIVSVAALGIEIYREFGRSKPVEKEIVVRFASEHSDLPPEVLDEIVGLAVKRLQEKSVQSAKEGNS